MIIIELFKIFHFLLFMGSAYIFLLEYEFTVEFSLRTNVEKSPYFILPFQQQHQQQQ